MEKKVYKVEIQSTIYQFQSTKLDNQYTGRPQKFFSNEPKIDGSDFFLS